MDENNEESTNIFLGLRLPSIPEGTVVVEAVMLLKVLRADGTVGYHEWKSATLHPMEALGMIESCSDTMRNQLMQSARRHNG
jgi:hypothetical protein